MFLSAQSEIRMEKLGGKGVGKAVFADQAKRPIKNIVNKEPKVTLG